MLRGRSPGEACERSTRASRTRRAGLSRALVATILLGALAPRARAAVSEAEGRADDAFDIMNVLAHRHLHDIHEESWNAYGQFTWISSFKLPFSAPYSDLNHFCDPGRSNSSCGPGGGAGTSSLGPRFEHSFTATATLWLGLSLWRGAEIYWVPEVIAEQPLSGLRGLGGAIQNFELQKTGSTTPSFYSSRLFLKQTFQFGGAKLERTSDPMQLGTHVDSRRLVISLGNFSVLDFLDKNSFAGDLRKQFFNMAFLTYAAYDFAADARGYTWGGVAELYWDDWTVRFAHIVPPRDPNQLAVDFRFWQSFGEQVEVEHLHRILGQPGAVRLLGYWNHENIGRFDEAIAAWKNDPGKNAYRAGLDAVMEGGCAGFSYHSTNAMAPDLCWARRPQWKGGIGLNIEQNLTEDIGLFFRGMYSDGQHEVYSYTSTDYSLAFGVLARGTRFHRPRDIFGAGYGVGWISSAHAQYLALGGVDGFIGDGKINAGAEGVFETFYGVSVLSSLWLSADYQHIAKPAFNGDRGPVDILGARLHAEF